VAGTVLGLTSDITALPAVLRMVTKNSFRPVSGNIEYKGQPYYIKDYLTSCAIISF
jgi:hypothetical protein